MNLREGAKNFQVGGVLPQWGGTLTVGNFSVSQWYLIWNAHVSVVKSKKIEKYRNTLLLNTIIKYNMNKHSEPLFQKK